MNKLAILACSFLYVFAALASAQPSSEYVTEKDMPVPMRDGVTLRADVLRPSGHGQFPVLVYRTPYGKEFALREYSTFRHAVERGYAVVIQDVRGRYASAGDFLPYQQEGHDGYDTIEWAAAQPWSDGSVGTFGLSYPGAVQWLAAVENPPHLKAMVPAMTFSTPQNFFYAGGTWDMSWIEWIWDNIAPDVRVKRNLPGPKTHGEAAAAWRSVGLGALAKLPLSALPELQGIAPYYYQWLQHRPEDPWWDWAELRDKYDRVRAAVLNFSAWYDDNYGPEGATTNFTGLLKARVKQTDARTHLLIGPWVHGVDATAKAKAGDRQFDASAVIDYDNVVLRWLDHYVRGVDNGVEKDKRVRYFVMGRNEWRERDSWPPPADSTPHYLSVSRGARGLGLQAPIQGNAFTSFMSDPAHPVLNPYESSGAHDYSSLGGRKDVLTFDTAPLDQSVEVTGPIRAKIFMSCDCRDADVWVRLLDVAPDGKAFNLMNPGLDVIRASHRNLASRRQLLTPNKIYELDLANLITSNVFLEGHQIRVQISGSFFPNFSRNLQTGEREEVSGTLKSAEIRIYHDRRHPSRIVLPIAKELP